ncbi:MAG: thioredoxin [Gemmatimonadaceae bacterium]|nr:thioredoxin [Gemmatimonadaceae bacterium]NUO95644.1 thioredoxin [Gemmatimonadaceae bacterium]NUP56597.1 thioredoxin [Gemmatimonadaceae bacterium]NUR35718.1 thioredoxin [Gemmatimonadaceae bacterium]
MPEYLTLTDSTFSDAVERAPGLTLVDFWAPWCPPCLLLAPTVERVSRTYAGRVRIAKLDVDTNQATMTRYGVRSIPTLLLFQGGEVVASLVGAVPQARIEALLDAHLAPRAA